ncbi:hypothetical protein [Bifidobacterium scaligerum]|uniref:Uncharacterized protein n=1 Tax=Bifidobacterium scaligerum TaxID=2052656 RepID=A0A2M9HT76_9BIFI|nr:hypothetical protein [Bifidobacterium scaligerum]PJM80015.1 hypothetical protein CUU80_02460 [Bifidobacterium scaligerum]
MEQTIENGTLLLGVRSEDTGQAAYSAIPLTALAAWRELLGAASDVETVGLIMAAADPGVIDPDTGRNAWTSAYEQLEHDRLADLNQVKAASLHRAFKASGALAVDGRAETRRLLGLPETVSDEYESDAAEAASLALDDGSTAEEDDVPDADEATPTASPDTTGLESLLKAHAPQINILREQFLDDITPRITDRRNQ